MWKASALQRIHFSDRLHLCLCGTKWDDINCQSFRVTLGSACYPPYTYHLLSGSLPHDYDSSAIHRPVSGNTEVNIILLESWLPFQCVFVAFVFFFLSGNKTLNITDDFINEADDKNKMSFSGTISSHVSIPLDDVYSFVILQNLHLWFCVFKCTCFCVRQVCTVLFFFPAAHKSPVH